MLFYSKKTGNDVSWFSTGLEFNKGDLIFEHSGRSLDFKESKVDLFVVAEKGSRIYISFNEHDIIPFMESRQNHSGLYSHFNKREVDIINQSKEIMVESRLEYLSNSRYSFNKVMPKCYDIQFLEKYIEYNETILDYK